MLRIVLVDDDRLFINAVRQHIDWEALGLRVCGIAYNGLEALDLCARERPDILLTDMRMPGLDGISSAIRIHEAVPHCHIIFMSAYAQAQDYRKAIHLRALDFLEKPLDMEELTNALRHAVAQTGPPREIPASQPSRIIRDVMHILESRYMENLTVDALAQAVFFTPNYLSALFRKETGSTISQYLTQCRLEAAVLLLRQTNRTVAEISEAVGYHDVRHFSKVFQKRHGVTPSSFRKQ